MVTRYEPLFPIKEYFKKVLTYKGYFIYDTEHSVVRYHERVGEDITVYENLLKKGIDWLIDNKKTNIEDRYLWYSKEKSFGIQVHWRPDRNTKKYGGYTATTLSDNEMKILTQKDKKIFLENLKKFESDEKICEWIFNNGYARYEFDEQLKEEMDLINYDMFIDGKNSNIYRTFELITL
jgi:hypothetical protein